MDIKITPNKLGGIITVPASKSISHRAVICAALADGESVISNHLECVDTEATMGAMSALGAKIAVDGSTVTVNGISVPSKKADINCHESGSTLRFLMPVAAALGTESTFFGRGKLPERPVTPYFTEFEKHGIIFNEKKMPYRFSGKLTSGEYTMSGDISSQFITGLLFALPLLDGNSRITLTSPLQSKPYVDITIDCMKKFGVSVSEDEKGYTIKGNQRFTPCDYTVEGDMSQAAFFLVGNCIGGNMTLSGLNPRSVQGDKAILQITRDFAESNAPFDIDAEQIPDLVPILTVLGTFGKGTSFIRNCARLRIKECDRLAAISTELNKLGAKVEIVGDMLKIEGVEQLNGGVCDSWNDHRIAMSLAIASQRCTDDLTITGANCVEKSYPDFFEDFGKLGGKFNVITV